MNSIPRPEYPRPQLERSEWINLNGTWSFEIDHGVSGRARGLSAGQALSGAIVVPFCPESTLSGVGNTDFMNAVWYQRSFTLPDSWAEGRTLLHFGAADYETEVWINGISVGTHRGGYAPFCFDISAQLKPGENVVVVCCEDDLRSGLQPRGKQSGTYHSRACDYTRTTGIWQTVWLERVPLLSIASIRLWPDPDNACLHIDALLRGEANHSAVGRAGDPPARMAVSATLAGKPMGEAAVLVRQNSVRLTLPIRDVQLWQPDSPTLYDLRLVLQTAAGDADVVTSYFGLRSVSWNNRAMLLNGKPLFQRLVLDQGFYPDGIYTAPNDDELRLDIERAQAMGFNGARLHQKVFEPRFLYWADRLGYLVWGEHGSWGLDISSARGLERFLPEWMEIVQRDFNHPALVGWCPFNETWDSQGRRQDDTVLARVYEVTKQLDPQRPVIDTSGNFHVVTDIYDIHDYDQNPDTFAAKFAPMAADGDVYNTFKDRQRYAGQPYFVSEYGGIWWDPKATVSNGWGYGNRPASEADFLERYRRLTTTLLQNPRICAFCYTQLYDIEQEVNGLYTYQRKAKFDPEVIRAINQQKAAIEI